jgi:hypothetical protein
VLGGGFTHLIVEGPEWPAVQLSMVARRAGLTVLGVRCDRYPADYDRYFDRTILPTEDLRAELKVQKAAVIPDMIEVPEQRFKPNYAAPPRLRVVWVGHHSYRDFIQGFIADLARQPSIGGEFEFITVSSGPGFTRTWGELSVVEDILAADVSLIPVPDGEWFKGKSSNRLAMMFSLGMPTVASPLNAYLQLGRHDENLLFARTPAGSPSNCCACATCSCASAWAAPGGPRWMAASAVAGLRRTGARPSSPHSQTQGRSASASAC